MGFYLKKSFNFGPFRLNLSKSGLGLSTGIKGFRVGTGPRGCYVHMGRGGLYYRQSLGGKTKTRMKYVPAPAPRNVQPPLTKQEIAQASLSFQEIDSADTAILTDASSQDIVNIINTNSGKMALWPLCLLLLFGGKYFIIPALVLTLILYCFVDRYRRTTAIIYDIDEKTKKDIEILN